MFKEDKKFSFLDIHPDRVMVTKVGLNQVTIKVDQFPPQSANAYVVGWYAAKGVASIVAYLYCPKIARSVAYRPEPAEFPMPRIQEYADAAAEFLESMGFMMDDVSLASMPPHEQERWIARIPVFHPDLREFAKRSGQVSGGDDDGSVYGGDNFGGQTGSSADDAMELSDVVDMAEDDALDNEFSAGQGQQPSSASLKSDAYYKGLAKVLACL